MLLFGPKARGTYKQTFIGLIMGIVTFRIARIHRMKWGWRSIMALGHLIANSRPTQNSFVKCPLEGGLRIFMTLHSCFLLFAQIIRSMDIENADNEIDRFDGCKNGLRV